MTIELTDFDMVALARRGLQALFDEASTELRFARKHAVRDERTGELTPESIEAGETARRATVEAMDRLVRFTALYGSPAVEEALSRCCAPSESPSRPCWS
ncbi:hypothetical protein [Methylorubrum sp. DB1722]|uniref:hypothetical protein n=1 Tax=Methylorubrum sp. DB1722 TaxID=2478916 RepID=UPI0018E34937|nr:hypothetical protein [Methylorubrum sp. DB1722]MBI1689296.1 hypothetical protein [Methylorubrum sp. DB1722]